MAGETTLTIVGNLTDDPSLTFTQSGSAVANFTVASTPRTFDKAQGKYVDGEPLFMRCSVWREMAESVAESLTRGNRVIVMGQLKQRKYTPKDGGDERTVFELEVSEIGPSLKWATAKVARATRSGIDSRPEPADDPWGSAPQAPARQGASGFESDPPF